MSPKNLLPPEDGAAFKKLQELAESIHPRPEFESRLEQGLRRAHRPESRLASLWHDIFQFASWAAATLLLALFLNWLIQSGRPVRIPAVRATRTPAPESTTPDLRATPQSSPEPQGTGLDWRGTKLYINAELPGGPEQAAVLALRPEEAATVQSVHELAARFGIQGQVYRVPGEIADTANFMLTDGRQRLQVRSDRYFAYYPDYPAYLNSATTLDVPDAGELIGEFMRAHGIDMTYRVEKSEIYGGFYALPVAAGDLTVHHQYFKPSGYFFRFGREGILAVEANLLTYQELGTFGLLSAREALDMVLDPNVQTGLLEGMTSAPGEYPAWYRVFPTGAPVSFYGHLSVVAPVEGQTPFIAVDGYPARGNLTGLESLQNVDLIHVTGQFHPEEGMMVLEIQSWQPYAGYEDGLQGTLQKQGGEIVLVTAEGQTLLLPDMPAEVPLPLENAFVLGVQEGGTFQWKSIDLRMTGGGGGGGGSGLGLYRLNLSGTPVPFPTATPVLQPTPLATGEGAQYTVQAGDTFASIAAAFGITQEALMQANGVTDAGTLFMGQVLLVPGSTAQQVDGWHGLLIITLLAQPDGSQQTQYGFVADGGTGFYVLDGDLSGLAAYHNRPVTLWGVIGSEELNGSAVIHVDRYEIPYPDLAFTILRGIESNQTVNGDMLTLLTTADGQIYVMLSMDGMAVGSPVEPGSEDRLVEALMIPGESYAGHPAIRVFSKAMATNPKNGQPMELPVTADQPYVQEARPAGAYNPPTAAIEKVELVYFITDPRYKPPEPGAGPAYIQPVWRFSGRYSNGDVFEILVQALRRDFLSPEIEYVEPPG